MYAVLKTTRKFSEFSMHLKVSLLAITDICSIVDNRWQYDLFNTKLRLVPLVLDNLYSAKACLTEPRLAKVLHTTLKQGKLPWT